MRSNAVCCGDGDGDGHDGSASCSAGRVGRRQLRFVTTTTTGSWLLCLVLSFSSFSSCRWWLLWEWNCNDENPQSQQLHLSLSSRLRRQRRAVIGAVHAWVLPQQVHNYNPTRIASVWRFHNNGFLDLSPKIPVVQVAMSETPTEEEEEEGEDQQQDFGGTTRQTLTTTTPPTTTQASSSSQPPPKSLQTSTTTTTKTRMVELLPSGRVKDLDHWLRLCTESLERMTGQPLSFFCRPNNNDSKNNGATTITTSADLANPFQDRYAFLSHASQEDPIYCYCNRVAHSVFRYNYLYSNNDDDNNNNNNNNTSTTTTTTAAATKLDKRPYNEHNKDDNNDAIKEEEAEAESMWSEMYFLPSRYSAPPSVRSEREAVLRATAQVAVSPNTNNTDNNNNNNNAQNTGSYSSSGGAVVDGNSSTSSVCHFPGSAIRQAKDGTIFQIGGDGIWLWNVYDDEGYRVGQAALFDSKHVTYLSSV